MQNQKWIGLSVILLAGLLGAIGYNITNQTYFCSERGLVMECARFSGSKLRCYPNLFDNKGYRDCSEGWIKVEDEVEIEPKPSQTATNTHTKGYLCDNKECKPIS